MRESKSKNKNNSQETSETSFKSMQMELELMALKTKNFDLIKANTQLVKENAEMKSQIYSLQSDLLEMQTKYNNVELSLLNFQRSVKDCTPNLVSVLNLFLNVQSGNCLQSSTVLSLPDRGDTPRQTGTVKPHAVNGTVLNLNPTISLTRINQSTGSPRLVEVSDNNANNSSSLGNVSNSQNSFEGSSDERNERSEIENNMVVKSRGSASLLPADTDEMGDENSTSDLSEESMRNNLSMIPEESYCLDSNRHTSTSEVRIILSPLSAEDIETSLNRSRISATVFENGRCLNVQRTGIENIDTRASKRLKADIMLFSPNTNSTRLESSFCEVTSSSQIKWLPTPSMSAMGDIDCGNGTRVNILKEECKQSNISPITPISNLTRYTRSKSHPQSSDINIDQSPKSTRESSDVIDKKRSISQYKSPMIILEKLENKMPNHNDIVSNDGFSVEKKAKNNQNDNENKLKKCKSKIKSKSPKSGTKRKHKEDAIENIKRLSEIKIEVTRYLDESDLKESSSTGRPKRAARPRSLKDASLKGKLRRMF